MYRITNRGGQYFCKEQKVNKVISVKEALEIVSDLRYKKRRIVIAGGIFDLLHIGHIRFLQKAKNLGDVLLVLLENDSKAKTKGPKRPINRQGDRAEVLSSISFVDYVIVLDKDFDNSKYDEIILNLKPDIIAVTKGSSTIIHADRQAAIVNARVVEVISRIKNKSTTKLANIISKNF